MNTFTCIPRCTSFLHTRVRLQKDIYLIYLTCVSYVYTNICVYLYMFICVCFKYIYTSLPYKRLNIIFSIIEFFRFSQNFTFPFIFDGSFSWYGEHVVSTLYYFFLSLFRTLEHIGVLGIQDIELALVILWILKFDPPQQVVLHILLVSTLVLTLLLSLEVSFLFDTERSVAALSFCFLCAPANREQISREFLNLVSIFLFY